MTAADRDAVPVAASRGPLTVAQQQLWALERTGPAPAAVNLNYALAVNGPLDVEALSHALNDLVRSHDPLRSTYRELDGVPVAEVAAAPAHDRLAVTSVDPAEAAELALRERGSGFDLTRDPPIRVTLLRLGERHHVLLLSLHHIVADGWSMYLVSRHLSRAYARYLRGEPPAAESSAVEGFGYAAAQSAWLAGPEARTEVRWWIDRLRGATARPALLGAPRPDPRTDVHRYVRRVPDALASELHGMSRRAGVSLFVLLLTAFEALAYRWSGCPDLVVGTLAANRPTADSARILGAHYNTLLLGGRLDGDPSLAECLLTTSVRTVNALDHQRLPYPLLADALAGGPDGQHAAGPALMLLTDQYPMRSLNLAGCEVTGLYVDEDGSGAAGGHIGPLAAATTADLTFFVREVESRLTLSALYVPDALDGGTVAGLVDSYLDLLGALCGEPEQPLSTMPAPEAAPAGRRRGGPSRPALRAVTRIAPVDALSPVGRWPTIVVDRV